MALPLLPKWLCLVLTVLALMIAAVSTRSCYLCDIDNPSRNCNYNYTVKDDCGDKVCYSIGALDRTTIFYRDCGKMEIVQNKIGATIGKCMELPGGKVADGAREVFQDNAANARSEAAAGGRSTLEGSKSYIVCACTGGDNCNEDVGKVGEDYGPPPENGNRNGAADPGKRKETSGGGGGGSGGGSGASKIHPMVIPGIASWTWIVLAGAAACGYGMAPVWT